MKHHEDVENWIWFFFKTFRAFLTNVRTRGSLKCSVLMEKDLSHSVAFTLKYFTTSLGYISDMVGDPKGGTLMEM